MVAPGSSVSTREEAAATVAYLASDVVYSVQPSLSAQTGFSAILKVLSAKNTPNLLSENVPLATEVEILRQNADPFLSVLQQVSNGKVASVTTTSATLISAIPHLYKLARYPVTIHVALAPSQFPDYSEITSIRQSGFSILQSTSLRETADIAPVAHALALESGKGVIHFFESAQEEQSVAVESKLIERIVDLNVVDTARAKKAAGSQVYWTNDATVEAKESTEVANGNGVNGHSQPGPVDVLKVVDSLFNAVKQVTGRAYSAFEYSGPSNAEDVILIFGSNSGLFKSTISGASWGDDTASKVGVVSVRVYRPWVSQDFLNILPRSTKRVAVLEQIRHKTTRWGPLFLDVLTSLKAEGAWTGETPKVVGGQLGYITKDTAKQALRGIVQNLRAPEPVQNLLVGNETGPDEEDPLQVEQPKVESAYMKILNQVFGQRLHVANALEKNVSIPANVSSNPEFGLGQLFNRFEARQAFVARVSQIVKDSDAVKPETSKALQAWLPHAEDKEKALVLGQAAIDELDKDESEEAKELLTSKDLFAKESSWLVSSDAWSYDIGNSGIHHLVSSGKNVNMLIIDNEPYSTRAAADAARRKKDIGLYAMNYGGAYVASVAVYSSYTGVLNALLEADKFDGPSVVLAYLPYASEQDSAVTILQETKKAVDTGYWPLYRWNPALENQGQEPFQLDSERVKKELKDFLQRENHLTQIVRKNPALAHTLTQSYGTEVRAEQKRQAKMAFDKLLEGLQGPPLTILYGSDGGQAANLAKRLERRARARGLKAKAMAADDYPVEELHKEVNFVFVTATAGQGEFPQNARQFWETVKSTTDLDLVNVNFTVFGLGDSNYWPRKEDYIYYNKPSKDMFRILSNYGGKVLLDLGLGDDQDPDGWETAYGPWEQGLWKALGVDQIETDVEEPKPRTNEDIKIESNFLRGTIAQGLADETTGAISADDAQLGKFHGTYMQDDRDIRDERKAQGLEPAYSFMVRMRLPAGVCTPEQWLKVDEIATQLGNDTFKLTTRQTFQFHGVVKRNLIPLYRGVNQIALTCLAACGDVVRTVTCSTIPERAKVHEQVYEFSKEISNGFLPETNAYHEIWLDDGTGKKQIGGDAVQDLEPLYSPIYLPRKFKIGIAVPPSNDIDLYTHDLAYIAIVEDEKVIGYNVCIGGGMGTTHNNKKTYPRLADCIGYVTTDKAFAVGEKVISVQRDFGNRSDRKNARLKYTIDAMGLDKFKAHVEERLGYKLEPERPFVFDSNVDAFGWKKGDTGTNHFTMFIENGRIEGKQKQGLRELAQTGKGRFRLTANQHLMITDIEDKDLEQVKTLLAKWDLDNLQYSGLRLSSSACVALPTCGLAMAESERYLPVLVSKLETVMEEAGLKHDHIVMRMTGCPNGCARPWVAEVAFVGKAPGTYNMYLGGGWHGERINKLFKASINEEQILKVMTPMIQRYAKERHEGEKFGDWSIRAGYVKPTLAGREFHNDVSEDLSVE
ncbi:sulfite reductase hemo protein [Saitoella complicata NRRL Y-17804]|nr:sulfite reductase hemo protein [Saitoella complicata NRRL Y-17804]ODQ56064.1 sulfite reductase hemo protein [Saitoella complicata NRRL Y-17804]